MDAFFSETEGEKKMKVRREGKVVRPWGISQSQPLGFRAQKGVKKKRGAKKESRVQ